MASSVEWTKQIETMYAAGGRIFIEVGPKRALTMFAMQILEDQPHVPIMTNHPKQGGMPVSWRRLAHWRSQVAHRRGRPWIPTPFRMRSRQGPLRPAPHHRCADHFNGGLGVALRRRAPCLEAAYPLLHRHLWPFNQVPWIRTMQGTKPSKRTLATDCSVQRLPCIVLPRACLVDNRPRPLARRGAERRVHHRF